MKRQTMLLRLVLPGEAAPPPLAQYDGPIVEGCGIHKCEWIADSIDMCPACLDEHEAIEAAHWATLTEEERAAYDAERAPDEGTA